MIKLKEILYCTDFSEYSAHARPYAIELAKQFKAKLLLIHVAQVPSFAVGYEIAVDIATLDEEVRANAKKKLEAIAALIKAEGVEVETMVEEGSAFARIVSVARERKVDMIVMATHGWGVVKHMLMGSTAEKVVRKAPCPVLTIRHPEHEFVSP